MANPRSAGGGARVVRTSLLVSSVVGVVLGLVALFWPGATLITIATIFGVALIVAGLFRVVWALADSGLSNTARVALGVLGLILIAAGVLALFLPVATLIFIAVLIGVSWILSGVRDLVFGIRDADGAYRWLAVVAGGISVIGGVVIVVLPLTALGVFTQVAAILLVLVSLASLLTLPIRSKSVR